MDKICSALIRGRNAYSTVGTYSPGNAFVVYEISRHVFPMPPSPTITNFMLFMDGTNISDFSFDIHRNDAIIQES